MFIEQNDGMNAHIDDGDRKQRRKEVKKNVNLGFCDFPWVRCYGERGKHGDFLWGKNREIAEHRQKLIQIHGQEVWLQLK